MSEKEAPPISNEDTAVIARLRQARDRMFVGGGRDFASQILDQTVEAGLMLLEILEQELEAALLLAERQAAGWRQSIERNRDAYQRLYRAEQALDDLRRRSAA